MSFDKRIAITSETITTTAKEGHQSPVVDVQTSKMRIIEPDIHNGTGSSSVKQNPVNKLENEVL